MRIRGIIDWFFSSRRESANEDKIKNSSLLPPLTIFPISDYIEKYPLAFITFGEMYPDPTTWDRFFILDKFGINWELRSFFARHGLFMEVKRSTLINNKKISQAGFAVTIRKDSNTGETLYRKEGHPMLVAAESIETLFAFLDEILMAEENNRKPEFNKDTTELTDWNKVMDEMNFEVCDKTEIPDGKYNYGIHGNKEQNE